MKKTITLIMGLALSATLAVAQDKPAAPVAAAQQPATAKAADDPIVVAAGDVTIRKSEFESALKTLPPEYQQYASGPGKKQFAEDYLRMKMLAAQGMKENLQNDPEVIQQLNLMRENLVANAELQKIEKAITISDADLQKVYDQNKKEYEQVKARHILVAFKGSPAVQAGKPELTEEQAKAKAEELKKKVDGGAKFEDVAKAESDDKGSGSRGGDLGSFTRGQMVPEFETPAFEAKVGDVIGPIRTQYGYHIIQVQAHDTTPFAEVKGQLEKKERQTRMQAMLDSMKKGANATFNDAYFAPPPSEVTMEAAPTQGEVVKATPKAKAPETKKGDKKKQ